MGSERTRLGLRLGIDKLGDAAKATAKLNANPPE